MDRHISRLLKSYHLCVAFMPLERKGYLVHTSPDRPDVIFVKDSLSDSEAAQVILHEIGHYKHDNNVVGNYSVNYVTRVRCEHEADKYMLDELIREHANLDYDVSSLNYVNLAESLGVNNYLQVRKELSKYKVNK